MVKYEKAHGGNGKLKRRIGFCKSLKNKDKIIIKVAASFINRENYNHNYVVVENFCFTNLDSLLVYYSIFEQLKYVMKDAKTNCHFNR